MATIAKVGAGHFICGDSCKFTRHTHIDGRYCVSTVGEYHGPQGPMTEIGYKRTYETMVFDMRRRKRRWQEIDYSPYNDREAAQLGHRAIVRRWERKARKPAVT